MQSKLRIQPSGISGLDHILSGGFPSDRLYLVDGDPGSGKTTLGLQFLMEGARRGERVLYVTLSETKAEIQAVAESHGWKLDGVDIVELRSEDQLTADDQSTFFHPAELELGETTKAILAEVQRVDPTRVVFDSLSEMRLLAHESLRYRRQILALKQYFVGRAVTVLLMDDRTSERGDLDLHSLVHGVIRLEQLAPEFGAERRRLRIIKLRGVKFRGGFHDFDIRHGGIEVFPRLIAADYATTPELELLPSGVKEMDNLLCGGVDRGSSTLFMGPAGSGKSTLALQYAITAVKNGEKAALFAFDEGRRSIFKRSAGLGMPVQEYVENGSLMIRQIDPAELSPGEFVDQVRKAVDVHHARVIVIDSLNGYLNAMPEERFLVNQMHELLSYLNQKGVATFLVVAQHGVVGTHMESPVDISYLADTVVVLRYFELCGHVSKAISVVKRRSGPHESTIREIRMSNKGISIGQALEGYRGILTGVPHVVGGLEARPL